MKRIANIVVLTLAILFAAFCVAFWLALIQNYRSQFDMDMTHAEMTRHVRNASIALAAFVAFGVAAAWQLVRVIRRPTNRTPSPT